MVLGGYVCDIPPTGSKAFIHNTTNSIISMIIHNVILLNGKVIQMAPAHYLITLICRSISITCSSAAVVLRVDIPGTIVLVFSKFLPMDIFPTYIPRL